MSADASKQLALALCKAGRSETGEGTCALICMDQLGDPRSRGCPHAFLVHQKAVTELVRAYAQDELRLQRWREVIKLHGIERVPLKDIANLWGVTPGRVSAIWIEATKGKRLTNYKTASYGFGKTLGFAGPDPRLADLLARMAKGEPTMSFYKFTNTVDGDEDPIFIEAEDEPTARKKFSEAIGDMPADLLRVEQVAAIPDGQEALKGE